MLEAFGISCPIGKVLLTMNSKSKQRIGFRGTSQMHQRIPSLNLPGQRRDLLLTEDRNDSHEKHLGGSSSDSKAAPPPASDLRMALARAKRARAANAQAGGQKRGGAAKGK